MVRLNIGLDLKCGNRQGHRFAKGELRMLPRWNEIKIFKKLYCFPIGWFFSIKLQEVKKFLVGNIVGCYRSLAVSNRLNQVESC
jgi:hypothetical protein